MGRTCCVQKLFLTFRTISVHNMFSPCSAKRRASDKDLKFIYSEKATKFCEISTLLLTTVHCNPLQGNYRVELLHREIPVVITGNEFTEYNFLLFWLHFFPCFINIEIVALVPVMCTGNCQFILQGLKGCFNTL